jgi:quercetin dioxygenase-like cupin family protein
MNPPSDFFEEQAMREVRIFELEQDEPAATWRVARPSIFKVIAGEVWLTVEGDAEDYWLSAGETFELPRGAAAWVSAGKEGARFALASGSEQAEAPMPRASSVRQWLPRWLLAA